LYSGEKQIMKTRYFSFLLILSFLASGCSKYGYVQLKYPTAPEAVLPSSIKSIAVVNRSLVPKTDQDKHNAITEAILTGEVAGSDKLASDECVKAVFDGLNGFHDIKIVYPPTSHLTGTGTRSTPDPLSWARVRGICDSSNADVLLVLEMFDSNSDVLISSVTNTVGSVLAGNAGVPPPPAQIRMNVVSYWRLYDPREEKITDQYETRNYMTFNSTGLLNLPPPEALPQTAYDAGDRYAQRFLPGYYYVKRDLYKRGKGAYKEQFRTAFRKTEVANWEGAAAIWSVIANSATGKNAGRACLNMAVCCEVLGKTKEALVWAKKGYEDYGNRLARDYANILSRRLNDE
jgi:hypothetical protein